MPCALSTSSKSLHSSGLLQVREEAGVQGRSSLLAEREVSSHLPLPLAPKAAQGRITAQLRVVASSGRSRGPGGGSLLAEREVSSLLPNLSTAEGGTRGLCNSPAAQLE